MDATLSFIAKGKSALTILACAAFLCACGRGPGVPRNGNLSAMPVIADASYYDNSVSYIDNGGSFPEGKLIEPLLDQAVSSGLPGGVILIDTPEYGTWVCAKGNIDIKNGIPLKKNSMSRIGSITKTFVSVIVLQLNREGRLGLDDPISKFLPGGLVASIENADKATIRQLLNHTSGIFDYADLRRMEPEGLYRAGSNKNLTSANCLKMILGRKANFKPGERASYCNTGYVLLGMIVEAVEKKPIKDVFRERIFAPLGMKSTYYDPDNPIHKETARGYADLSDNGNFVDMTDLDEGCRTPDGGIVSNVYDLSVFVKAIFENRAFLSAEALADMMSDMHKLENRGGVDYGLGLMRFQFGDGTLMYGHSGGHKSYTANLYYFPEKHIAVASLFNSSLLSGRSGKIMNELWSTKILDLVVYKPIGEPIAKRIGPATTASIRKKLPTYDDQLSLWKNLDDCLLGQRIVPVAQGFTIYHGNAGDQVDLEVVQPVDKMGIASGAVEFKERKSYEVAAIIRRGPANGKDDSYAHLNEWIKDKGYRENGPVREYYYKNKQNEVDENEYITEIQIPIIRR
jgi:D-alanyl-D-alanine carboxypeptidase